MNTTAVIAIVAVVLLTGAIYYYRPVQYAPWLRRYSDLVLGIAIGTSLENIIYNLTHGASLMLGFNLVSLACLIAVVVMSHRRTEPSSGK